MCMCVCVWGGGCTYPVARCDPQGRGPISSVLGLCTLLSCLGAGGVYSSATLVELKKNCCLGSTTSSCCACADNPPDNLFDL